MGWGGGGLFEYSVEPGPYLSRFRLGLVRLVTRSAKARFGDQVSKVKDQVSQGQGQELDNISISNINYNLNKMLRLHNLAAAGLEPEFILTE